MRRIVAAILMVIYLFNLAGYSWLFDYLSYRHGLQKVIQLDSNSYSDEQLVELKVPLYLPYFQSWPDYERYDGEIELNGIHYNFVKRKVVKDTLYMLCLPDFVKTEMKKDKNSYAAGNSDDKSSSKQNKTADGKSGGASSDHTTSPMPAIYLPFISLQSQWPFDPVPLPSCYIGLLRKPPKHFC